MREDYFYSIKWPRRNSALVIVLGAGLVGLLGWCMTPPRSLYESLWTFPSVMVMALGLLGLFMLIHGSREFLNPAPILLANESGITVFSVCSRPVWDEESHSCRQGAKRGTPLLIPYGSMRAVRAGTLQWVATNSKGHRRTHEAPALVIDCHEDIQLDSYGSSNGVAEGNGSTFFVNARYIHEPLEMAIHRLDQSRTKYSPGPA